MADTNAAFLKPGAGERVFNRLFGIMVGLGLGLAHNYLLEVRGRKTGNTYSTPVNVLDVENRRYLVCGRGRAQWVRNAEAAGRVTLKKGSQRIEYTLHPVANEQKPALLKHYLDRYKTTVQRYFPMPAGSPASAFDAVAGRYPVFELITATIGDRADYRPSGKS
ncbi:MAG: nitroreductase family deazaflavin-dependent oxidoreductase [Candidatus Binataceae bacterium]